MVLQNVVFDPVEVLERGVLEPLDVGAVFVERLVVMQADLQRVIDDQQLYTRMTTRIGWLAVPDPLGHWIASNFDPSPQLARLPVRVLLGTVAIRAGRFEVGGDGR